MAKSRNMKYLYMLGPAIDSFGLITQTAQDYFDGGDTLQREGMFAIAIRCLYDQDKITIADYLLYRKRYWNHLNRLYITCGNYKRHVDPAMWYSGNSVMSRDQWTPNVIAMGMLDLDDHNRKSFWGHGKRLWLFTTNTRRNYAYPPGHPKANAENSYRWKLPDLTILSCWGNHCRSHKAYLTYPLLCLTDLDLLVSSLIWLYKFRKTPNDTDILNHVNSLIQAQKIMPTPVSRLARKLLPVDVVLQKLKAYFSFDGPRIDLLFAEFLRNIW